MLHDLPRPNRGQPDPIDPANYMDAVARMSDRELREFVAKVASIVYSTSYDSEAARRGIRVMLMSHGVK